MICDTLQHLGRYRGLHPNLDTAIDYLLTHDLAALQLGRTEVDGDKVFINLMDATLHPDAGYHPEYHKLYADLQVDLTGSEGWGYTNLPGAEIGEFTGDCGFQDSASVVTGALGEGRFVLFFPEEWRNKTMDKEKLFAQIKGGLIVSCQALEHEPLYTKEGGVMPLMAKAAAMSGAVGIRANTVRDITQIKQVVDLPVIGIIKKDYPGTPMYITVTMKEVDELVACGVDILAVQGTGALRPDGSTSAQLSAECPAKIIAEGHIHYPEQAVKALEAGAFALVVGGAITRPAEITARFTGAINAAKK